MLTTINDIINTGNLSGIFPQKISKATPESGSGAPDVLIVNKNATFTELQYTFPLRVYIEIENPPATSFKYWYLEAGESYLSIDPIETGVGTVINEWIDLEGGLQIMFSSLSMVSMYDRWSFDITQDTAQLTPFMSLAENEMRQVLGYTDYKLTEADLAGWNPAGTISSTTEVDDYGQFICRVSFSSTADANKILPLNVFTVDSVSYVVSTFDRDSWSDYYRTATITPVPDSDFADSDFTVSTSARSKQLKDAETFLSLAYTFSALPRKTYTNGIVTQTGTGDSKQVILNPDGLIQLSNYYRSVAAGIIKNVSYLDGTDTINDTENGVVIGTSESWSVI